MRDIHSLKSLPNIQVQTLLPLENINLLLKRFRKVKALNDMPTISSALINAKKAFDIIYLQSKQNEPINEALISEIIETFKNIMKQAPHLKVLIVDDTNFIDVLYKATLTLASFNLLNTIDPYTQAPVDPSNQVITSTCHQFDVESLFNYLKTNAIDSLKNPFDNLRFNPMDQQTILNAVIQFVKRENITDEINTNLPPLEFRPPIIEDDVVDFPRRPMYWNNHPPVLPPRSAAAFQRLFGDEVEYSSNRTDFPNINNRYYPHGSFIGVGSGIYATQERALVTSARLPLPTIIGLTILTSLHWLILLIIYCNNTLSNRSRQGSTIGFHANRTNENDHLRSLFRDVELTLEALERNMPLAEEVNEDNASEDVNSPRPGR